MTRLLSILTILLTACSTTYLPPPTRVYSGPALYAADTLATYFYVHHYSRLDYTPESTPQWTPHFTPPFFLQPLTP